MGAPGSDPPHAGARLPHAVMREAVAGMVADISYAELEQAGTLEEG
jgi:hypothetical protein